MLGLHLPRRRSRAVTATPRVVSSSERDLALCITREFREMPGLCLTLAQTARLFSADQAFAARVLESLVSAGVLYRERGLYRTANTRRKCA